MVDGPGFASGRRPVSTRRFRLVVGTPYILAASLHPFLWPLTSSTALAILSMLHFDLPFTSSSSKVENPKVMSLVERYMQDDGELTLIQLHRRLLHDGINISKSTVLRSRSKLGWTFQGSHYCQMIREVNKAKRLQWAKEFLHDDFHDVVWTDETTVQLQSHKRFCCRKMTELPRPKPRPKHPVEVHVWGGISWNGRTKLVIFEGIIIIITYFFLQ